VQETPLLGDRLAPVGWGGWVDPSWSPGFMQDCNPGCRRGCNCGPSGPNERPEGGNP